MGLTSIERAWLRACAEAIFAPPAQSPDPRVARIDRFADEVLAASPFKVRVGFRAALWLVSLSPVWMLGRPRSIAGLSQPEAVALLERWGQSRSYLRREMVNLLKVLLAMGWCALPEVQRKVGIERPDAVLPEWAREEGAA